MFPLNKNSNSISRNEGFLKKSPFSLSRTNVLTGRNMYIKTRRKWFPVVGKRTLDKKELHLNLNNGFN